MVTISQGGYPLMPAVSNPPDVPPISLIDAAILPGDAEIDLDGRAASIMSDVTAPDGSRVETVKGFRWEGGFRWLPRQCGTFGGRSDCGSFVAVNYRNYDTSDRGARSHMPVVFVAQDPCPSAMANDWDFKRQSAIDALVAAEYVSSETELWDGPVAQAALNAGDQAYVNNLWLTRQGVATDLTPTPGTGVSPQKALSLLEDFSARLGYGGVATIHMTPGVLPYLPWDFRPSGRVLYSTRNSRIVPGSGYSGNGPSKTATAQRSATDGVTNSTTTFTSASATFTAGDVGSGITGTGIPAGTTIASRTNGTTVVLSQAATASASGVHFTITGGVPNVPAAGTCWAYVTDRITYRHGPIIVTPDLESQSLNRALNQETVKAERTAAATWDTCAVGAVLIALP